MSGVVCANFGTKRTPGPACKRAWHGKCYWQHLKDPFPVMWTWDLDDCLLGLEALEEDDPSHFKWARDGDHLMCPFQCDECHFYNIQRRPPRVWLMMCIRRASLDAFWSREMAMVVANQREAVRVLRTCERLGINRPYPARGPFAVNNDCGMMVACQSLLRSLDPERNSEMIQFETMRKL